MPTVTIEEYRGHDNSDSDENPYYQGDQITLIKHNQIDDFSKI